MKTRNIRTPFVVAVVLMAAGAFTLAIADQVVYFANGKAIMVKKVEHGEEVTILEIEGGGRLGVPTAHIVRIEEYAVSKPDNSRPPAAQQPRTAARTPPATPRGAGPGASAAGAPPSAAVNEPANLVADAPSVVPGGNRGAAAGLAAPRETAQGAGAPATETGIVVPPPPRPEVIPRPNSAASKATALAAQKSAAAKMQQQRLRGSQLSNPRGRGRAGAQRGQALMGGQSPRRPGQGAVKGGTTVPTGAREEIVPAAPDRRRGKGNATGETPPPTEDEKPEETPSEAN